MARTFRFWFYLALMAALLASAGRAKAEDVTVRAEDGQPWTIRITPAIRAAAPTAEAALPPAPEPVDVAFAAPILPPVTAAAATALSQPAPAGDDHGIVIAPARPRRVTANGDSYDDVYQSIPYSFSEYLANPSYRHDSTMEILFGQLRPTTIVRNVEPQTVPQMEWTEYRPYLFAEWDYFQTAPLLRPRCYSPLLPQGFYW